MKRAVSFVDMPVPATKLGTYAWNPVPASFHFTEDIICDSTSNIIIQQILYEVIMENVRAIALTLFSLDENLPCRCGGSHEVCLQCRVCRADAPVVSVDPTNPGPYIDHTILKPDAKPEEVDALCAEADAHRFASVCVNPLYVARAKATLKHTPVCSVIGFPLGTHLTATKVAETLAAITDGAVEIDMVIDQGLLKAGLTDQVEADIADVAEACRQHGVLLKVIHENCNLTSDERIIACLLSKHAGADYVKTSTGFGASGATEDDVRMMRAVVGPHYGVKAAGGIRDRATAIAMLRAGADRIGASRSIAIIGAAE
jgi:deoxyribose-phosphate aldolase